MFKVRDVPANQTLSVQNKQPRSMPFRSPENTSADIFLGLLGASGLLAQSKQQNEKIHLMLLPFNAAPAAVFAPIYSKQLTVLDTLW